MVMTIPLSQPFHGNQCGGIGFDTNQSGSTQGLHAFLPGTLGDIWNVLPVMGAYQPGKLWSSMRPPDCFQALMGHKERQGHAVEKMPRSAAEYHFARARMTIGAHDDQIGAHIGGSR